MRRTIVVRGHRRMVALRGSSAEGGFRPCASAFMGCGGRGRLTGLSLERARADFRWCPCQLMLVAKVVLVDAFEPVCLAYRDAVFDHEPNAPRKLRTRRAKDGAPVERNHVWTTRGGYHGRTLAFLSSLLRRGAVALVRRYQRRARSRRPARCRYHPSCSTYAIEAIERYGLLVGGARAARRILRCRPPFWGVDEP